MNPDEPLPSKYDQNDDRVPCSGAGQAREIQMGRISVTVQENAAKSVGSRIFLAQGDQHTVEDLYIAMAVGSANDATVAFAEHVSGSEQDFVEN